MLALDKPEDRIGIAARGAADGGGVFRSTKTFDHSEGLSCCFRQWRAGHSHCRFVHGYALAVRFVFATRELDHHGWCFDFGGLKPIRAWLHQMFDHTTIVAEDDPQRAQFEQMQKAGLMQLRVLPAVGCEATAHFVAGHVAAFVAERTGGRVWLESVEVREHGGNAAIYTPEAPAESWRVGPLARPRPRETPRRPALRDRAELEPIGMQEHS